MKSLGWSYNPCLVDLPNVICVGGTDPQDALADFSNYGAATVHVGAPGVNIISTVYENASGIIRCASVCKHMCVCVCVQVKVR
jgi:hypothetical protein